MFLIYLSAATTLYDTHSRPQIERSRSQKSTEWALAEARGPLPAAGTQRVPNARSNARNAFPLTPPKRPETPSERLSNARENALHNAVRNGHHFNALNSCHNAFVRPFLGGVPRAFERVGRKLRVYYDRTYMNYDLSGGAIYNLANGNATKLTCFDWKFEMQPKLTRDYLNHAVYEGPKKFRGQEVHAWRLVVKINGENQTWLWYTSTEAQNPHFVGFESKAAKAVFWFNSHRVVKSFDQAVFERPTGVSCSHH
jgi:hypothetical protein